MLKNWAMNPHGSSNMMASKQKEQQSWCVHGLVEEGTLVLASSLNGYGGAHTQP